MIIMNTPSVEPSCRCYDCTMTPESSHGIHLIGVYSAPARLSRRGGKITIESVNYWFPFDASNPHSGGHVVHAPIVENASAIRYINNF